MPFNRKTILVVDSNKTFVLYMGIMLKRMGFNVVPADSGPEALKLMKMVTPDLVLMDSCMPATDGYDTLLKVRSDEETREVPVVMMMTRQDRLFASECGKAGCNGFLPKPVPMDLLHDHIQDFIFSPLGFRRKHLRVQADIRVMLTAGGASREYHTETMSEGGAYLKTDQPLKVGTRVTMSIPYKGDNLNLKGSVIYIKSAQDGKMTIPAGMAVEFAELTTQDTKTLTRLVSGLIAGDIPSAENGQPVMSMPWEKSGKGGMA